MTSKRHRLSTLPALLVPAVVAVALTGCGSSDKAPAKPALGSPERPLVAQPSEPGVTTAAREPGSPAKSPAKAANKGSATHPSQSAKQSAGSKHASQGVASEGAAPKNTPGPNYQQLLANQTTHPGNRFSPCNLVTASEARAIVGAPMQQPVEAPQGPTCVYRTRSGKRLISLAVQTTSFNQIKPQIRHRQQVAVSGRAAFCGVYGQPMLYVPLTRGRVLSITAPCATAKGFALRALPHL